MVVGDRANRETDMTGLSYGERLLVWSWRKIVTGSSGCPLIAREFSLLCGEDGDEVLANPLHFLAGVGLCRAPSVEGRLSRLHLAHG